MQTPENKLVRFDWAMKRLLRNKANFAVLEGLLTTLLNEKITIKNLLESESNQEYESDKYNRVDILAQDSKNQLILIEIQNNSEIAYFKRMLFDIRKIYSVNIVYFALGRGSDYVYHGKTEFRGIHTNELLDLSPFQKAEFNVDAVSQLYPEYYILRVNGFNKVAKSPLEEWIYYLNTGEIPATATAPGLDVARERLKLARMSKEELAAYYRHLDDVVVIRNNIYTARKEGCFDGHAKGLAEGLAKGREEGLAQGLAEEKRNNARKMKELGIDANIISQVTGLSPEEINAL